MSELFHYDLDEWEYIPDRTTAPNVIHVTGYTPHDGQWLLHENTARFRVVVCGRRFGKTFACVAEMLKFALENPNTLSWWVAPYNRTTKIAYRLMSKVAKEVTVKNSRTELRIELVNGSVIEFRSAENYDALRGEGIHFLVIDEAALVARQAWEQVLRPMLTDTQGRAIFISTPKGRNWFFELFMRGLHPDFPNYASIQLPSSMNPLLPKEDLEEAKKTLPPDVYEQEYEAKFLEDSAGVFRGVRKCVRGTLEEAREGGQYICGWDIAKHSDYSVITVIDVETHHVVYFDRFNQIAWSDQIQRVERVVQQYNDAKLWMDSTGVGDAIFEQVQDRGIDVEGFKFTSTSKKQLIQNLMVMIVQQEISFPEIAELIHELEIFQYEMTPTGNIKYSAPQGGYDDSVMSLALSCWGLKEYTPMQLFI